MRLLVDAVAGRVRMWRSIRIARRLTAAELAATAEVDVRVARAFLAELEAVGRARGGIVKQGGRVFVLVDGESLVPPPREKTNDQLRQVVWDRIRAVRRPVGQEWVGPFGVEDLAAGLDRRAVTRFVETLTELGYLERLETQRGRNARWTLVRDTGPAAPLPAMGWVAYDPNLDRMVTREKVRRG